MLENLLIHIINKSVGRNTPFSRDAGRNFTGYKNEFLF